LPDYTHDHDCGMLFMRGLEVAAALLITAFGALC
jgi:hypothetical protein